MSRPEKNHQTPGSWVLLILFILSAVCWSGINGSAADGPRSVSAIRSRAEFDVLAVTYDADTPYALPHMLFVIDRQNKNRIYYVNTKLYKFHKDFVNGTYLDRKSVV